MSVSIAEAAVEAAENLIAHAQSAEPKYELISLAPVPQDLPQRPWFVEGVLMDGSVTMLTGKEGEGNLAYASQSMGRLDRFHRRIARLAGMLSKDGEKPTGMHWATYNWIVDRWKDAEENLRSAFTSRLLNLVGTNV